MKKLVLLFSHQLTEKQMIDAKENLECDEILYMPKELKDKWQNLGIEKDLEIFKNFLRKEAKAEDYILIQGEWGATYEMVNFCKNNNLIPVYSSTKREVIEKKDGEVVLKLSKFIHRAFIRY